MKTKLSLTFLLFTFYFLLAGGQVPQGFNYQAIARDPATGNPIASTSLPVRITIQSDSLGTGVIWQELHSSVTSNSFGLITLVLGKGARQSASNVATFSAIDWSVTPKFIKTEIDFGGWKTMGVSRFWSVPYALRAKDSDQWQVNGEDIYRQAGKVGIGTSTPLVPLSVYNPGSNTTIHIGGTAAGQTYLSAGTSASTNGYSYLQSIKTAGTAYGDLILNNSGGKVGIGTAAPQFIFETVGFGALIRNPDPTTYSTLRLYNDKNSSVRSLEIDYMGSTSIWGEQGSIVTTGAFPLNLGTSNSTRLTITSSGNVGIGTTSPSAKLHVAGEIYLPYNSGNSVISMVMGLGNSMYFKPENNLIRIQSNHTGNPTIMTLDKIGNVGFGTTTSTSKVAIQPAAGWDDSTPLFEVKNKTGVPIFAVYNNGVRILIDHSESKGIKSGFAVGGYDMTKAGKTVDFMLISPDSIRFNINNDNVKGLKGGFAVGGYDMTKGPINQDFMYITPQTSGNGRYNTFLGFKSGTLNTTGIQNSFFGYYAGYSNNGSRNVFIGDSTGFYNASGGLNVFIGNQAGRSNITGGANTFLGHWTGWNNTIGYWNTFIGIGSGFYNIDGKDNIAIGHSAGSNNKSGNENIFIGSSAGSVAGLDASTGSYNVFIGSKTGQYFQASHRNVLIGYMSGNDIRHGSHNVLLGVGALPNNMDGIGNIAIGTTAGNSNTAGNYNVFLGYQAGYNETGSNKLYIANSSTNTLIYGDFSTGNVGIGTTSPATKLDVIGCIRSQGEGFPTTGSGIEVGYISGSHGIIQVIDRSGSPVYRDLRIGGYVKPSGDNMFALGSTTLRWTYVYAVNGTIQTSDSRLKKDIASLNYGLESIMKLNPVSFSWKDDPAAIKHLGLVAQDVIGIIKEVVDTGTDPENMLGINYSQLVPVLIKGMQEQQDQIESTKQENQLLRSELQSLREEMEQIKGMLAR